MSTTVAPTTRRWVLDPARSTAAFDEKTFWGLHTVTGSFDRLEGSYVADEEGGEIELTLDAASVDTGHPMRDRHLRSEDFFHAEEHPIVRFRSTNVTDVGGGVLHVSGELEAAGRTVPLSFDATVRELGDELEIESTTTIDQRRLGMSSGMLGMIRPPATLHVTARLADRDA
jgi:polyisoprenoid-binding protein YceI